MRERGEASKWSLQAYKMYGKTTLIKIQADSDQLAC